MQEGNKSLGIIKNVQFGREIFTLSLETFILALLWLEANQSRENVTIKIAPKHNNSLETFPYAIQKHLAMHQSDFTLQIEN